MARPAARHESAGDPDGIGGQPGGEGRELLAPLLPGGEPVERLLRQAQFFVPGGSPAPFPGGAPGWRAGRGGVLP